MILINQFVVKIKKIDFSITIKTEENQTINQYEETQEVQNTKQQTNFEITEEQDKTKTEEIDNTIWQIQIPKIDLIAPISNGTTVDVLNSYVGHFEETQNIDGNIGLAGHNRGYPINYFEKVKELEVGDIIIYEYYGNKRTYEINIVTIIEDTDWAYLENTEDNRITLITCVEDQPSFRRCIQAVEKNM